MKAYVNITIMNNGHENVGGCVIVDNNGLPLAIISSYYPNSNAIYAAYKTFQLAGQLCRRIGGYTTLIARTNCFPMIKELNGNTTRNTTLLNQTKRYLSDFNYSAMIFEFDEEWTHLTINLAKAALEDRKTFTSLVTFDE